jgi:hypothetical protein
MLAPGWPPTELVQIEAEADIQPSSQLRSLLPARTWMRAGATFPLPLYSAPMYDQRFLSKNILRGYDPFTFWSGSHGVNHLFTRTTSCLPFSL